MKPIFAVLFLLLVAVCLVGCSQRDAVTVPPNASATPAAVFEPIGTDAPALGESTKGVISATMTYTALESQGPEGFAGVYEQTITDPKSLETIVTLISQAEPLEPVYDCLFEYTLLTLTMADGTSQAFHLAADSCTIFTIDGNQFNFMPPEYRNSLEDHPDNRLIYDLFPEIPRP